ncbi:MAG: DUF3068 domain-containing protein [Nocardioides sp.]|nr:DUF3068 domain-containing protein [Nocardioides sp.]
MRRIISWVLLGLGAFLLVTAVVAKVWAPGQIERTPLDTNATTRLAGTADKLNPSTGKIEDLDVRATSFTKADSKKSDNDVVVFVNTTCLVVDKPDTADCGEEGVDKNADPNVISITTEVFAADRYTGLAVNGEKYLPADAEEREGLQNKFPFNTEKKDYEYWDGMLGETVTAAYDGTEKVDGLETYRFKIKVEDEPAEVTSGIDGIYSTDTTIWIEPKTGAIVNQEQHEVRTLENGDPLLDLDLAFTDKQVETNVDDAKDNVAQLDLLTSTVPLLGFILGPILIVIGVLGLVLSRRRERTHAA